MPFGWVCFSNAKYFSKFVKAKDCLNCLSAGSVSLTRAYITHAAHAVCGLNCLSAGSVSLTRRTRLEYWIGAKGRLNCLSAGSVSLTGAPFCALIAGLIGSQLPFGWVCFSNSLSCSPGLRWANLGLNCLSAGSVSLTTCSLSRHTSVYPRLNCLSAGSVSLTYLIRPLRYEKRLRSQLPFGWVCFSNFSVKSKIGK